MSNISMQTGIVYFHDFFSPMDFRILINIDLLNSNLFSSITYGICIFPESIYDSAIF